MFCFNFSTGGNNNNNNNDGDDELGEREAGAEEVEHEGKTTLKRSLPWEGKVTTKENRARTEKEIYDALNWDEKWWKAQSVSQMLSKAEKNIQFIWHFDMINDTSRNKAYCGAIGKAINETQDDGTIAQEIEVLDIGTGSGFLALSAAVQGAGNVTAIEVEEEVARVASRNVDINNLRKNVSVVRGHSMSPSVQVPRPVHIIATELLDTGLLGEDFIVILRNAKQRGWLRDGCRVIPTKGRVFGQLVECEYMSRQAALDSPHGGFEFNIPDSYTSQSRRSPFDMPFRQLLDNKQVKVLSESFPALTFDFEKLPGAERYQDLIVKVTASGRIDGVMYWWEVDLDRDGEYKVSSESSVDDDIHQDHWVQAFSQSRTGIVVEKESCVHVSACHDDTQIWFRIADPDDENKMNSAPQRSTGDLLSIFSPERLLQMNCSDRSLTLQTHLQGALISMMKRNEKVLAVTVGDGPWLPLYLSKLLDQLCNSSNLICLESERTQKLTMNFLMCNGFLPPRVSLSTCDPSWIFGKKSINFLCAEPFFNSDCYSSTWGKSALVRYWMCCHALQPYLASNARLLPARAVLMVAAVECKNLWLSRQPLSKRVEQVDLIALNSLHSFEKVDSVQLWRYSHRFLSRPVKVIAFDFLTNPGECNVVRDFQIEISKSGACHGLAMWIEYDSGIEVKTESVKSTWCSSGPDLDGKPSPYFQGIRYCNSVHEVSSGGHISCKANINVLKNEIAAFINK